MIRLRKGKGLMKYFKIKNNQVYFLNQENKEIALDQITKEDLLFLINKAFDEDFEFDKYDSDKIKNQAHNLIYKNIENKFSEVIAQKDEIIDEVNNLYKAAIDKYGD